MEWNRMGISVPASTSIGAETLSDASVRQALVEDEPLSLIKKAMKHSAGAETGTRKSKKSRKAKAKEGPVY